uniref:Uncharacterized protein n=1 Tax=Lepeophtheirus salmonis TaxID=72036 RepID=A0A0K2UI16_LEPSM
MLYNSNNNNNVRLNEVADVITRIHTIEEVPRREKYLRRRRRVGEFITTTQS